MKPDYTTLAEAIKGLKEKGYTADLNLTSDALRVKNIPDKIMSNDFEVDYMYRFEGMSSTGDNSILYAISSKKYNLKGLLVDAYGTYAEPVQKDMLEKLRYKP